MLYYTQRSFAVLDKAKKRIVTILYGIIFSLFFLFSSVYSLSAQAEVAYITYKKDYTKFFSTASSIRLSIPLGEEENAERACQEVEETVSALEKSVSISFTESDIYRFNNVLQAGEKMEITQMTYDLLTLSQELYQKTDGAYNPAVAPLVDLWGFSPRFSSEPVAKIKPYDRDDYKTQLPAKNYVKAFCQLTSFNAVKLETVEGKYYITKPQKTIEVDGILYGMQLDLGGIAKGYACDIAAEILNNYGFEYGYVSMGSSSMRLLQNKEEKDGAFCVKIKNPRDDDMRADDDIFAEINAESCGLSTSGDYERYYVTHNRRYSHLISAETGEPMNTDICTACVVGGSAAENDALTTALCIMGKEKATKYITENLSDRTALFVWENADTGKFEVITNQEKTTISLNGGLNDFQLCGYMQNGVFIYMPSENFHTAEIIAIILIFAVAIIVIAGLGYRNYVLKRSRTNQEK